MASEIVSGASTGAQAGASVGGGYGAIIGAVVGAVGGLFARKKRKKQKKFARAAQAVRRRQQSMRLALQRRDIVRQGRAARAQAIAAGSGEERTISSGVSTAAGAIGSQLGDSLNYFDQQVALDNEYQRLNAKAGKYARQGEDLNQLVGAIPAITNLGANIFGSLRGQGSTKTVSAASTFEQSINISNAVNAARG